MKKIFCVIAILLAVLIGCAHVPKTQAPPPDTYAFSFNDQPNVVFQIPNSVPNVSTLSGYNMTLYASDESKGEKPFAIIAFIGQTKDEKHRVGLLHALEGRAGKGSVAGKDFRLYIIAISHISASGKTLWYDKSYFEKGIASGRYTKYNGEDFPSLDGVVKMKTGKIKWEI